MRYAENALRAYEEMTEIMEALPVDKEQVFVALLQRIEAMAVSNAQSAALAASTIGRWVADEASAYQQNG